jgi:hypothetical protein
MTATATTTNGKPHGNVGNTNRRKHGAKGTLTLSRAAKGEGWLRYLVRMLKQRLEAEVAAANGEVSIVHEGLITSICRAEMAAKLIERWGRQAGRTEQERLDSARQALDYSERRDRLMERLFGRANGNGHNSNGDGLAEFLQRRNHADALDGQSDVEPPDAAEGQPEAAMGTVNV